MVWETAMMLDGKGRKFPLKMLHTGKEEVFLLLRLSTNLLLDEFYGLPVCSTLNRGKLSTGLLFLSRKKGESEEKSVEKRMI